MRMIAIVLGCAALAACSSVEVASEPIPPPDMSKVMPAVRSFATQVHLAEPLEFSGPLEAPRNYFQRWMLCIRSAATPRKTYALFSKKKKLKHATSPRLWILVTARLSDRCRLGLRRRPLASRRPLRRRNIIATGS
jgi:hypothetical protein